MILWIDAQLSPDLVPWFIQHFGIEVRAVRDLGLKNAKDREIFFAARTANAIVMTKDSDFLLLLDKNGPPPQVIWLTCGNTSNAHLREILKASFEKAVQWLQAGERLVEISDASSAVSRR